MSNKFLWKKWRMGNFEEQVAEAAKKPVQVTIAVSEVKLPEVVLKENKVEIVECDACDDAKWGVYKINGKDVPGGCPVCNFDESMPKPQKETKKRVNKKKKIK